MENSIADLLDLLEEYSEGNVYTETYDVMTTKLAHPQKIHPVKFFLVSQITILLLFNRHFLSQNLLIFFFLPYLLLILLC